MKKQIFHAVLISSAVLAGGFGCKQAPPPANNLGTVDGEPISMDEFHGYIEHLPQVQVRGPQGQAISLPVAQPLGRQAIQSLIEQRLLLNLAKDEGVTPTAAEIDAEIDNQKKRNPDFIKTFSDQGYSLDEIRHLMLVNLAEEKIITKGITIKPEEAKKYINDHKEQFSSPPMAKMLFVLVNDDKGKAEVDKALGGGQQFAMVAMKYSVQPNAKQTEGAFPVTNMNQMKPDLKALVEKTAVQKTTDWYPVENRWAKFYVQSKSDAKLQPITDDVLKTVERFMAKQQGGKTTDIRTKLIDKVKAAKVDLSSDAYKDAWADFVKSVGMPAPAMPQVPPTKPTAPPAPKKK